MDSDAAVVKHAKSSRVIRCGMVQTGDGNESSTRLARHHRIDRYQRGADDMAGGLVNATKRRCVARIQIAESRHRPLTHQLDIRGAMKPLQLLASCGTSAAAQDPAVHAAIV
jgi:hypothetical protein